ncbi:hypothetical protein M0Q97_04705 [Candidatus Dojkabacteria bacterium]|jgi:hypothetical protein|nr:hypothetical protein [Candidatus Dojkabacteria bacterium]
MENKITVNIPEGYIATEEKIENGVIITFLEKEIDEQKAIFFKERIEGCTIRFNKNEPNSILFEKDGQILFELKEFNDGEICFQINDSYLLEVFEKKYNTVVADALLFLKIQVELIFKILNVNVINNII